MALKEIIIIPDKRLREISKPIDAVTPQIRKLADDMLETMYDAPGIGLAAIQIGVPERLFVVDLARKEEPPAPICFINPKIIRVSEGKSVYEEGCLSIPDYYGEVERPESLILEYQDLDGALKRVEADGLLATCIQHELDHLNGIIFIDYLSRLKRSRVMTKFEKLAREKAL